MNKKRKYVVVNERRLMAAIAVCLMVIIGGSISIVKYIKSVNTRNEAIYAKKETNKKEEKEIEKQENINNEKKDKKEESQPKAEEEKSENKDKKNTEPSSKEDILKNSVFVGDSITEGFSFYDIAEGRRVLAGKGDTTVKAMDYVGSVKEINPTNVFILYGMNDLLYFPKDEDFIAQYSKLIQSIKKEVPSAHVYVQSIFPIAAFAENVELNMTNARIDELNKKLINMCVKEKVNYIDVNTSLKGKENYFEPDGKHVKANFYEVWLETLRSNLH